jgi:1,4-dihydroxy-2-naphthoate polyprenyltransferase
MGFFAGIMVSMNKQIAALPCFEIMTRLPVIHWFDKSTVRHLRFPFSFFLLPVFMFALSQALLVDWYNAFAAFFILHFLLFPSSNGYNSYQDKDETSIGGLKNPPKVTKHLFYVTLLFDLSAFILALFISLEFSLLILAFIIVSRMYSYRGIRLKKYPVTGFLVVFLFQGAIVYLMTLTAVSNQYFPALLTHGNIICMAISSMFIGSMYPLTQIYQHEADRKDGVISMSYILGYRGTFVFSGILFTAATALLFYYFGRKNHYESLLLFFVLILPVVVFLSQWFAKVSRNNRHANFENTMKANILSSGCMNLFFLILIINNRLVLF